MSFWSPFGAEEGARPPRNAWLHHGTRGAIALALAAITYAFFPAAPAVDSPVLEVGSVAPDNVIARFAFSVPKSPAELAREQNEIVRSVAPIFRETPAALDTARRDVERFAEALRAARERVGTEAERLSAIHAAAAASGLRLQPDEGEYLLLASRANPVLDAVRGSYARWLALGVVANGALDGIQGPVTLRRDSVDRQRSADSVTTFGIFLSQARRMHPDAGDPVADAVYRKLLAAFFHPTIRFDRIATERARQELRASVPVAKYEVRAGQKIVGAHEVVSRDQQEIMRAMRLELEQRMEGTRSAKRILGAVLFNTMLVTLFGVTLGLFRPALYDSSRAVLLMAVLFLVVIGASSAIGRLSGWFHPELVPIAFAAVVISLLFDPRISLFGAMVLAVLIGGQAEFSGSNATFLALMGGTAAAFAVRIVRRRNQTHYLMALVAGAYLVGALAIGLALDRSFAEIGSSALWGTVNAIISVAMAMVLLPLAEQFAGVDTNFTLLEWSDLNRPLLRRLSLEAPGTYAHTIAIANLAEDGCNAIGANGLLARVGAYYHDIGKLRKPQYFVENQTKGRNPHDKLKPGTSAAIIRNHVREGLELAEENHVPRAVRAFILEHHGTNPIAYFLEKAKEREGMPPVNAAEFAYPGPKPQSTETAVVMLADGVEAAVRVLSEPTPERIREVVERIVQQRMDQGQLDNAPITLRQLETLKESFVRALAGMHHARIDYPAASGGITSEFAAV